jgi:hypothetical protein
MRVVTLILLTFASPALADGEASRASEPSPFRVYAGPVFWVPFFANNFDVFAVGGSAAFQYYPDRRRVFFVGGRLAFLSDPQGIGSGYFGGFADAEIGARPRLVESRHNAFTVVVAGGVGGMFIACPCSAPAQGYLHMSLRAGLGFDLGAFTMDALGGPAMFASGNGAGGAIETVVEVGVRF